MNLKQILDFVNFQLNKDQSGNTLNTEEYNLALLNANNKMYDWLTGLIEEYQPGRPIPRVSAPMTEKVVSYLRPFTVFVQKLNVNGGGLGIIPSNYGDKPSMKFNKGTDAAPDWKPVEILFDDQFNSRVSSTLRKPTLNYPICRMRGDNFEFSPTNLGWVELVYYFAPTAPVYATIFDPVTDTEVYDPDNSKELTWPKGGPHSDFAEFVLYYAATNLKDTVALQVADKHIERGK